MSYALLKQETEKRFSDTVRVLGYMPVMEDCYLESRHLGLITAQEVTDLQEKVEQLALQAEKSLDLDGIMDLAKSASPVCYWKMLTPQFSKVRIAVAQDAAFCFYYEDSLRLLEEMGAELISFSPLMDEVLPAEIDGLYLGGGYPELYAGQLSQNWQMREGIQKAMENQIPCIAECGGFMYLTEAIGEWAMVGFLPGKSFDTGKLSRFGYVTITASSDNLLCRAGESIIGHEFHYWDADNTGNGFRAEKRSGKSWECVHATDHLYAGFPHFHFYANPEFAVQFYQRCLEYQKRRHDGFEKI